LVCVAVYKDPYKKLRTPYMFILVNLAVTDLVVGCITLPLSVATHTLEALGSKTNVHTLISRTTYFVSCTASILNLTAFCVDRYIAIKWPIKYRRLLRARACLLIAASIWVASIAITALYFVAGYIDYLFIFAHVTFLLALGICGVTFRLLRKLNVYARRRRELSNPQNQRISRRSDRSVTKLFFIILILFFICYTPAIIMMYILKFCINCNCKFRHVIRDLQFLFIITNSAVNPFLCTIRLKPFRRALSTIFRVKPVTINDEDEFGSSPTQVRRFVRQFTSRLSILLHKENENEEISLKSPSQELNGVTNQLLVPKS